MASYVRRDHNGVALRQLMNPINNMLALTDLKPLQEALGTSIVLNRARIPHRVITDHTTDFSGLKTIIVNDAMFMDKAEVDRLRRFVHDGGTLIATGMTSYQDMDGTTSGDFALQDVFGVSYAGRFSKLWNYLAPNDGGEMISNDVASPLVKETTATRLASVAEPLFDYEDVERFASYHSNPPGPPGEFAALTVNRFGRGTCVYLYSPLLAKQSHAQQAFGEALFRRYAASSLVRECTAPPSVEVTLLRGTRKAGYLLCCVNYQDEAPVIPIHDIKITIKLPASTSAARVVSSGRDIPFERQEDLLTFRIPKLDIVEMIEIDAKETRS